eukprot:CAMPEP_0114487152 /NCGR_PEP_ID=MMETSP0109-20121206/607_1 /TAXON_ID=29199 /ORGANISM="Chlorarachnion reptans, Strain CCCM449" /LENGTH=169 /DNA_ID=CAMNT_0001663385 /DNA_START=1 /DNA_END=510 /DNA_ORIENTATION=-
MADQDHETSAPGEPRPVEQMEEVKRETKSAVESKRVDFSGVWRSVGSENLTAFLVSEGLDEKLAKAAADRQVTQEITYSEKQNTFTVKTGSHSKTYQIGGSDQLHEVFGNMMYWDGDKLMSRPTQLNTSPGAVETCRRMENEQMVLTMKNGKELAVRYFRRVPSAVAPT